MILKIKYFYILFFLPLMASAAQLFFPAEKNNIRVLSQRFEYQLIDETHFRIGDVILDSELMKMSFAELEDSYRVEFSWPSSFVSQGELVLKDPSGKSLFQTQVSKEQIKKYSAAGASLINLEIKKNQWPESLFNSSYLRFCIQQNNEGTKVFLCSGDFLFQKNSKKMTTPPSAIHPTSWLLKKIPMLREDSFVEINGELVGPQGLITMNDPNQILSLRALMKSGMTLEMETKLKSVEFKDFLLSNDEKSVIIRGYLGEPSNEKNVRRLKNGDWEAVVPLEKPTLYLKGEGGIPLAQEFAFQGGLRKKGSFINSKQNIPDKVYSNSLSVTLITSKGLILSSTDEDSVVEPLNDVTYKWVLKDLNTGGLHRRYIKVFDGTNTFYAAVEVERVKFHQLQVHLGAPLFYGLQYRSQFHSQWSTQIELNSLSKSSDISLLDANADMAFKINSAWELGLKLWIDQLKTDAISKSGYSLGLNLKYFKNIDFYFKDLKIEVAQSVLSFGKSTSAAGAISNSDFIIQVFRPLTNTWSYSLDLNYHQRVLKYTDSVPDPNNSSTNIDTSSEIKHSQTKFGLSLIKIFP